MASADTDLGDSDVVKKQHRLKLGAGIAGLTIFGTLGLTAPFVLTKSPLPFMATPGHKVFRALCHIRQENNAKIQPQVFIDLGSGDGEAVYQAVKAGYQKAVGVELNFTLYALAQTRRFLFWSADERARSQFLWKNFFDYHIGEADAVMIFGVNPLMKALSSKLAKECGSGTYFLSYRFLLPTRNDRTSGSENGDLVRASMLYNEGEMRIYRKE